MYLHHWLRSEQTVTLIFVCCLYTKRTHKASANFLLDAHPVMCLCLHNLMWIKTSGKNCFNFISFWTVRKLINYSKPSVTRPHYVTRGWQRWCWRNDSCNVTHVKEITWHDVPGAETDRRGLSVLEHGCVGSCLSVYSSEMCVPQFTLEGTSPETRPTVLSYGDQCRETITMRKLYELKLSQNNVQNSF